MRLEQELIASSLLVDWAAGKNVKADALGYPKQSAIVGVVLSPQYNPQGFKLKTNASQTRATSKSKPLISGNIDSQRSDVVIDRLFAARLNPKQLERAFWCFMMDGRSLRDIAKASGHDKDALRRSKLKALGLLVEYLW